MQKILWKGKLLCEFKFKPIESRITFCGKTFSFPLKNYEEREKNVKVDLIEFPQQREESFKFHIFFFFLLKMISWGGEA